MSIAMGSSYNYDPSNVSRLLTTDYFLGGSILYEDNQLKMIRTEEGYLTKSGSQYSHHFYIKDHPGNNRAVVCPFSGGSWLLDQEMNYYPFGMPYPTGNYHPEKQPYKFGDKELDEMHGLNWYDFEARQYNGVLGRFMSQDPLAEKHYSWSPYVYCNNNPVRYVDPDGRDPGDVFKTPKAAAQDWGNYYNGVSILLKIEFGSSIYVVKKDGEAVGYAYSIANTGNSHHVNPSPSPNLETIIADIHSHGNYDEGYKNNEFSSSDKSDNNKYNITGYLASPDGSLQEYDPATEQTTIISTNLPSDPKDPDRKNNITPTDVPSEKRTTVTRAEQEKKPELKIPESQKNNIKWVF